MSRKIEIFANSKDSPMFLAKVKVQDVSQHDPDTKKAMTLLEVLCRNCPKKKEFSVLAKPSFIGANNNEYPMYSCNARGMGNNNANCQKSYFRF